MGIITGLQPELLSVQ